MKTLETKPIAQIFLSNIEITTIISLTIRVRISKNLLGDSDFEILGHSAYDYWGNSDGDNYRIKSTDFEFKTVSELKDFLNNLKSTIIKLDKKNKSLIDEIQTINKTIEIY